MAVLKQPNGVAPIESSSFTFKERVWWVLLYSKVNQNPDLETDEILDFLTTAFSIRATREKVRTALKNSGQNIVPLTIDGKKKYRISAFGETALKAKSGPIELVHVTGKRPYSDYAELSKLPVILESGPFQIVDKYFGQQSLDILLSLSSRGAVNFITALTVSKESKAGLISAARHLQTQTKNKIQIRIYSRPHDLHDRYIISKKHLVLIGHGLANFGQKESFMVLLDENAFGGIKKDLTTSFKQKWGASTAI